MSPPGYPIPSGFRASPCRGLSPEAMKRVQAKAESSRLRLGAIEGDQDA